MLPDLRKSTALFEGLEVSVSGLPDNNGTKIKCSFRGITLTGKTGVLGRKPLFQSTMSITTFIWAGPLSNSGLHFQGKMNLHYTQRSSSYLTENTFFPQKAESEKSV
jgi:hypothetical protein